MFNNLFIYNLGANLQIKLMDLLSFFKKIDTFAAQCFYDTKIIVSRSYVAGLF